jgi:hypothetical protein
MPINDDKLYEEIGRAWQQYTAWREKIFAGYLSVLAVLAFAFSKDLSIPVRAMVFASAFVVSVVFWILDCRTTELVNLCQAVGEGLADSRGFFAELNQRRFAKETLVSYGRAINVLVASVMGTSVVGLSVYMLRWWRSKDGVSPWWSLFAVVLAIVFYLLLQKAINTRWSGERAAHRAHHQSR